MILADYMINAQPFVLFLTWLGTSLIYNGPFLWIWLLWSSTILNSYTQIALFLHRLKIISDLLVLGHLSFKSWLIFLLLQLYSLKFAFFGNLIEVWFYGRFRSCFLISTCTYRASIIIDFILVSSYLCFQRRSFNAWIRGKLWRRRWLFIRVWSFWLTWSCLTLLLLLEHILRRSVKVSRL